MFYAPPTVDEVHEFMATINAGRKVAGLEPLTEVNFDDCVPSDGTACLSASMIVRAMGYFVGNAEFSPEGERAKAIAPKVFEAMGCSKSMSYKGDGWIIPDAIRVVTDPFDDIVAGVREAFVEAGYVKAEQK